MEKPRVRISVRNLVEFILRSGDLDNSSGTSGDKEAMLKGGRLHRKIQRSMKGDYQAEVSLKKESEYDDVVIQVEGRADGIFTEDGAVYIDEIKGTYGNVQAMDMPIPVHRAQAMCYGLIWGEKEGISEIHIQMTYAHLETEETRRFREDFSIEELKGWYQKLLDAYHKWIAYSLNWKKERNASMKDLQFPFPYREGQRDIVSGVYHTVSSGKTLFVQAPTGVGKTMSAIFPSVRAIGEGKGETLFYLTAKTITGTVAQEAFHILREKGLKFKVTAITAKEKLCFQDTPECTPEKCPYAKGHFDRVNDAVYELLMQEDVMSREVLEAQARKHKVCPFEMALDVSTWVDGVICDYNYVFDPDARLRRFFAETDKCRLCPEVPYRHLVIPEFFRLLLSCGLRCSEARLLTVRDVDLHQGILTVRDSKNHNSRLVPMPESMTLRLRRYAGQVHPFPEPSGYFFPGYGEKPMTLGNIYKNFRRFLWKAGISHTGDSPRVHDFRHAYCIYRLKQWAQQDRDLMVLIPMMRTYLGHQTFHETAYYLRWTADVFPDIRMKLEKCYKDIIPEREETAYEAD